MEDARVLCSNAYTSPEQHGEEQTSTPRPVSQQHLVRNRTESSSGPGIATAPHTSHKTQHIPGAFASATTSLDQQQSNPGERERREVVSCQASPLHSANGGFPASPTWGSPSLSNESATHVLHSNLAPLETTFPSSHRQEPTMYRLAYIPWSIPDPSLNLPFVNDGPGHNSKPGHNYGSMRIASEDNVPNRFELFILGDGEKKVTEEPDTRIPNASVFTFNKEDHTLANMLRSRIASNNAVLFAGYRVPHPMFATFELRVQTDGSLTPRAAVVQAARDLVNDLGILAREFTKEWELRKMAGETAGTGMER